MDVSNESGTDDVECLRKVQSGRKVESAIRTQVNDRSLQLECAWMLHEAFLMPVLLYSSETMVWRKNERSTIKDLEMDILRGLLGIIKIDRRPNIRITMTKGMDERINESVLRWFGHIERIGNNMIAKRAYVGKCMGRGSVG